MRNPVVDEWKLCKGDLVKSVVNRTASKKFTRVLRPNHWNERLGLIRKRVVFPAVNRTVKWKLINRIVKWFDQRAIRTRDTYQQGDWSRFKKHHCLCSIIVLLWTRNTYTSMSLGLFVWRLRREKYCVSTKLGVSNAYLRTLVSTQFSVKLRRGRVFGEAVDFTDRLFFFSCDLFTHFVIFTSRFFEEIMSVWKVEKRKPRVC